MTSVKLSIITPIVPPLTRSLNESLLISSTITTYSKLLEVINKVLVNFLSFAFSGRKHQKQDAGGKTCLHLLHLLWNPCNFFSLPVEGATELLEPCIWIKTPTVRPQVLYWFITVFPLNCPCTDLFSPFLTISATNLSLQLTDSSSSYQTVQLSAPSFCHPA